MFCLSIKTINEHQQAYNTNTLDIFNAKIAWQMINDRLAGRVKVSIFSVGFRGSLVVSVGIRGSLVIIWTHVFSVTVE